MIFDDQSFVNAITQANVNEGNIVKLAEHLNKIRLISMILDQLNLAGVTTMSEDVGTKLLELEFVQNNEQMKQFMQELFNGDKETLIQKLYTEMQSMTGEMFNQPNQNQFNELFTKFNNSVYLRYTHLDKLINEYNARKDQKGFLGPYEKVSWPGAWWCALYVGLGLSAIFFGIVAITAGAISLLIPAVGVVSGLIGLGIAGYGVYASLDYLHKDYYNEVQGGLSQITNQLPKTH